VTITQREDYTEVVTSNAGGVELEDGSTSGPAYTTTQQTASTTSDPYAVRRERTNKLQKGIYMVFGILIGLLGIRFVLGLLGANPEAGFAQFIYRITGPFLAPFVGLFGQPSFEGSVFEFNSLAAILVYALIAWVLVKIVSLVLGDSRRGVRTTTSSHTDLA